MTCHYINQSTATTKYFIVYKNYIHVCCGQHFNRFVDMSWNPETSSAVRLLI